MTLNNDEWEAVRRIYEAGERRVVDIAAEAGVSLGALYRRARHDHWRSRQPRQRADHSRHEIAERTTDRRVLLCRLFNAVERQIIEIEERLTMTNENPAPDDKAARALGALATTLDKLLAIDKSLAEPEEGDGRDIVALRAELARRLDRLRGAVSND